MAILRSGEHGRSKEGMRKVGRKEGNESAAIDVDDSRDTTTGQGTNKL